MGDEDLHAQDAGLQARLDGDQDGGPLQDHHRHTVRAAPMFRGPRRTRRSQTTDRTVRRDSTAAQEKRGPDRPHPGPGHRPTKGTGHPTPSRTVRTMQANGQHSARPPRPQARRPRQTRATATRMEPTHGQETQEKPHRLRRLPRSHPQRATNRDTHAVVTGEPDARKRARPVREGVAEDAEPPAAGMPSYSGAVGVLMRRSKVRPLEPSPRPSPRWVVSQTAT